MRGKLLRPVPLPPIRQSGIRATSGPAIRNPVMFGLGYLRSVDVTGNGASTPDDASLDILGDIDVRALVASQDWTDVLRRIIGKRSGASDRSWSMYVSSAGKLGWNWSVDGTGATGGFNESTPVIGVDDHPLWVRTTHDVNDGAGQNIVRFYSSNDSPRTHPKLVNWTLLSEHTNAGVTSIFNSTAPLEIGSIDDGSHFIGKIHYAEVQNGINGFVAANPDFRYRTDYTSPTQVTDRVGKVWTIDSPMHWVLPFNISEPEEPAPYQYHRHRPRQIVIRY